ncbi:glycoside hydrolase family 55 protein [Paraburkholderia sp. HD33-4]|uniref:glycoside hydrolase family 55 protein n=1 Tax=Paraburkholderia sp. HD33-4 TaxID=2883242 RepID=UPI001F229FF4|nr:glycoside hydrolase family 55 protein [Paraburkholderia sp. HD33-4]
MSVALAESPILSFLNNAGLLNAGGSLLTQVGGVNYPTYQDSAGATPLPNPIPLNSRGEISNSSGISCQLFLQTGIQYAFTLFDSLGNQLWTASDVMAIAPIAVGNMTDEKGSGGQVGFVNGVDFTAGTTTSLTLSQNYGSASNLWVAFDGVEQGGDTYTLSGNTLTFNAVIPVGTNKVYVKGGTALTVGTPGTNTVGIANFSFPVFGPTSARPVPQSIGQMYYDTTLGQSVVATAVSPAKWQNVVGNYDHVNVLQFGADPTGVADCTAALTAAIASCPTNQVNIYFPAGTYYFATQQTITMTSTQTNPAGLAIRGAGSGITLFKFAAASSGFTILYGSAWTGVRVEGISFLSPTAGGNAGLTLEQNATFATGQGQYSLSTMRDLEFRGSDGFNETNYWGNCCSVLGASNINWYDCTFYGPTGTPFGAGISLGYAPNDHTIIPVVYNLDGCSFTHLQSGLVYGGNCQGVTVSKCNFTGNFVGIIVPNTAVAPDQLTVNSSQFANINDSVLFQVFCQAVSFVNCFFLVLNNSVGINAAQMANLSIVGNIFSTANGSPVNQQGVQIGTYEQGAGVITGNQFNGLTIAIALLAASQFVNVQSNCYSGNGTNVNNAGTNNTIGGGSQ